MPRGSYSSARGGALAPHATEVVMQMFHARYPAVPNVFTAISNAYKQAGTQLSSELQHCSASCGDAAAGTGRHLTPPTSTRCCKVWPRQPIDKGGFEDGVLHRSKAQEVLG